MFTAEIRINGTLISHVYGRNVSPPGMTICKYDFERYSPDTRDVVRGSVTHNKRDGINALVAKILSEKYT